MIHHLIFVLATFLCSITFAQDNGINPIAQQVIKQAIEKKLFENYTWNKLLHYDNHFFKGYISDAEKDFFLAEDGHKNSKAELIATINYLYTDHKNKEHLACLYPARLLWLKKNLTLPNITPTKCKKLDEFIEEVKPHSVSMIFPVGYVNSPASAYGHLFLRINKKNQDIRHDLYALSVNFGANIDNAGALEYMFKGIFGGFTGNYSLFHYAKKVKEYSDLESRDIWEYDLNITPDESLFITLHLWELSKVQIPYLFFSKNCAYQSIYLISLVRQLDIYNQFKYYAIPSDIIRMLDKNKINQKCSI